MSWMRTSLAVFIFIALPCRVFGQSATHFYNVDKEITVQGKIQKIVMEPRYKDRAPFVVVVLETKESVLYTVELSPAWFFKQDLHQGEGLTVTGSLYLKEDTSRDIIAREIRIRGQKLLLRDKHGFPNWRGGRRKQPGRKRIKKL